MKWGFTLFDNIANLRTIKKHECGQNALKIFQATRTSRGI